MGYPGDQQPHRQPYTPSDSPLRRDAPPYQDDEIASPFGAPPREPSPYSTGDMPGPFGAAGGPRQDPSYGSASPYGTGDPYGSTRQETSPYDVQGGFGQGPGYEQDPYGGQAGHWPGTSGQAPAYTANTDDPFGNGPNSGGPYGQTPPEGYGTGQNPAMPPAPPSPQDGPGNDWDPYAPKPLWRRPAVLGVGLVALIAALFLGLWVASKGDSAPVRTQVMPTPTISVPKAPPGKYGYAESRATDKTPLSIKELFGKKQVTQSRRTYAMTIYHKDKTCADGISGTNSGSKLKAALKSGGCTQMIRASFRDAKGNIIGTIGVANLKTSAAAKKVASAGGGKERTDWLKPLPGKDTVTKKLGDGDAYAGGWTHGHYAVLLWFQFKDGHKPSNAGLKQLYQAAVDITDATVFPALETRSLTGGHA
ncbi:hypothetical protein Pth03_14640 [Planotetraspora thailandica]|uniref:Uncharacterized protein n=1 Tax=Planotetraspora thailandica TaxID=487172 RepID=A0A8J3XUF8_9ACTN|nr:hypothetical protein [Planotetraspora thailandica]GII53075.1 hypothetical protein Pth03_14640 [Planotetraspora thailandica]